MSEACKLDAEAVIAVVKLVGFEKKECQGTPPEPRDRERSLLTTYWSETT